MSSARWSWALVVLVGMVVMASSGLAIAADPPAAPKVSEFAPAADLAAQLQVYIGRAKSAVASADEYKDASGKLTKDANTVILIALALGIHDQDNDYKAAAPGLVKAAQELAKATEFAAAKAGVEQLEKAATSKEGNPADLKWGKVAALPEVMKAVPDDSYPAETQYHRRQAQVEGQGQRRGHGRPGRHRPGVARRHQRGEEP